MHLILCVTIALAHLGGEKVGKRPYELDWAGRFEDDHPPLVDFENLDGWRVETKNAQAAFERTREQQIWGRYVAKLTYRATGPSPEVRILPPQPIEIRGPFDAVTVWIYGNNWAWAPDPTTPQVNVIAQFQDAHGKPFEVYMTRVRWKEWFLVHRRLAPELIQRVKSGGKFVGFRITNCTNKADRAIYFDNLAVFVEQFPPLKFKPRPKRGIDMFPGQDMGTNTGPGRLPFPTRPETILPPNGTDNFRTRLLSRGRSFLLTYSGDDGELIYRYTPRTGTFDDITARWRGYRRTIRPCAGGGVFLTGPDGKPAAPEKAEHLGTRVDGDMVVSHWRLSAGEVTQDVTYRFRIWNKSLVIEVLAPGGHVAEVRFGAAEGLDNPRVVTNPYYVYSPGRPGVAVFGPPEKPLFLAGAIDWYLSNASTVWGDSRVASGRVYYNGGTRYVPKTNGQRNGCFERFFITIAPRYEEVLPTIPNPTSPWKHITGTRVWRAHGASNRENDKKYWYRVHRYGMTQMVVTDHETMWRDGGESFTFRTKAAPGKGGDEGQYEYTRFMIDKLGFVYGPYNNFTDFAPVNEYWHIDHVSRTPDNQLQRAWARCYAPKPAWAVEMCEKLAPIIQSKFHFNTAYCDVHTAVTPWGRVDYDWRVPGAGTFAAVFYSFGEIMLLQKKAWGGPVYSEGNHHFMYCGLTDGNYAQDQAYRIADNPWLVDFDLRRMHELCCNFGMGNPGMFYVRRGPDHYGGIDAYVDRFLCATVAFGHPGFLVMTGGFDKALRSYYMIQQLSSRYTQASAEQILYADENGRLWDTTAAVARGIYKRSQVVVRYSGGCIVAANGNKTKRMRLTAFGRQLDLPPNGYAGWTEDGAIDVLSTDHKGHRFDYAATPAYIYIDGRGRFVRMPKAAGNGIGICRKLGGGKYEVILYNGAECGFAIDAAEAVAIDYDRKPIRKAQLRRARGLTYVVPVEGAFSYILTTGKRPEVELKCDRDEVVPGETVTVRGRAEHSFAIPADAKPGQRIWKKFEGAWIDFTVVPIADAEVTTEDDTLVVSLTSNLHAPATFTISALGHRTTVRAAPGQPTIARLDLGRPRQPTARVIEIEISAGPAKMTIEKGLIVDRRPVKVADVPEHFDAGMCLRGGQETADFGQTRGYARRGEQTCGGQRRAGIVMHPPYVGGVGYTYALLDPVKLPAKPPAVFRALVGKGDGSDPGDGILYRVAVVDEKGREAVLAETTVREHKWLPIEADLSQFAGQEIRLKLIADVGPADNSVGDWACWADMRIESAGTELRYRLLDDPTAPRREPGPHMLQGLTVDDLRSAKRGWLHYEAIGLEGDREPYITYAILNGVKLGPMARASGDEGAGKWQTASLPLTPEAVAKLDMLNRLAIENPGGDHFKIRRFWLELELADGRRCSSYISTATFTQPPRWRYAEGILVPMGQPVEVYIAF